MLIHIVCWKYKPETGANARQNHIDRLIALKGLVPGMSMLEAGADVLSLERSFDTGLVAHFDDRSALDAYTVHPDHQAVAAIGREIAERVVSVDFLTADRHGRKQ